MPRPVFEQYRAKLLAILLERWRPRENKHWLRAVVRFSLRADGSLSFAEVLRPSGDPLHDKLAVDLVNSVARFPRMPAEIGEQSIFAFNFDSDYAEPQGAGVLLSPRVPLRETEMALEEPVEQ